MGLASSCSLGARFGYTTLAYSRWTVLVLSSVVAQRPQAAERQGGGASKTSPAHPFTQTIIRRLVEYMQQTTRGATWRVADQTATVCHAIAVALPVSRFTHATRIRLVVQTRVIQFRRPNKF